MRALGAVAYVAGLGVIAAPLFAPAPFVHVLLGAILVAGGAILWHDGTARARARRQRDRRGGYIV